MHEDYRAGAGQRQLEGWRWVRMGQEEQRNHGRVWAWLYSGSVAFFRLWLFMLFLLEEVLETIFTPGLVPFALPELKFPPLVLRALLPPPAWLWLPAVPRPLPPPNPPPRPAPEPNPSPPPLPKL